MALLSICCVHRRPRARCATARKSSPRPRGARPRRGAFTGFRRLRCAARHRQFSAIAASSPTGNASLDQALGNIIANVVATGAGAAVGGSAGAATASNADLFNRQLHPHEKQKLSDLEKGKSTDEQHKLVAAECALTQCAAGVPDNDPNKATLTQLQNEGQSYTYEQGLLKNAGAFDGYGRADKLNDWYDRDQMSNRLGGAVQGVESAAVAAGALGAGCASLVACGLGLTVATGALDYSKAGFTQMVSGNQTSTYGEQVLQGLGMSPYAAGLTYAGFNLGAAAGSVAANSAATQAAAQGVLPPAKEVQATNTGSLTTADQMGILREAAAGGSLGKGNFSLGQATAPEADALGAAWVGPGYRISSDGSSWVSSDGLRIYRPPSAKPNSSYATTGVQANFESKLTAGSRPISNGHLNITP
ncbi:hypothetical protein [Burkholderia glumae]|uniref:hypothetical protein n=1 Tax=Burkholderia glumae TaxID=337 RepID=UPI001C898A32|nr:hypothetical protein [Burkholderia glumae]MCQ0033774.1 hypothetical protein [Burkholderia glumae]MCQ0039456.1 hypothetical protein [Burkholderia glumae]